MDTDVDMDTDKTQGHGQGHKEGIGKLLLRIKLHNRHYKAIWMTYVISRRKF
jgi:hypothetical protein